MHRTPAWARVGPPRAPAGPRRRLGRLLPAVLALALALGACQPGSDSSTSSNGNDNTPKTLVLPQSSGNVTVLAPEPATVDFARLTVNIPEEAQSIGLTLVGSRTSYKFIDHGQLLLPEAYITGPDGNAPLAFAMIDQDGNGSEEPYAAVLYDVETVSVFFPNDGSNAPLPEGTYSFPIGAFDSTLTLIPDELQPIVYYKVAPTAQETLRLNIFVVSGVSSGITDAASAGNDPEILGAIGVLEHVFETQARLNLAVTVRFIDDSRFLIIDTFDEQDLLLKSYPDPATSDAMNIFVVGQLAHLDLALQGDVVGFAAQITGPFNLHGTIMSGTLAEYQNDEDMEVPNPGTVLGYILAHEFGHFLGLYHTSQTDPATGKIAGHDPIDDTAECPNGTMDLPTCDDRFNLMFPFVNEDPTPPITDMQGTVIRLNPAVSEPAP